MYTEEDLLPLSGLQHLAFCERRWALIHLEQQWEENLFTAEGKLLHEKAHSAEIESRPEVLVRRTLPLRSFRLGISGQADIVEFLPCEAAEPGVPMPRRKGSGSRIQWSTSGRATNMELGLSNSALCAGALP